jgi:hypothetical protein
LLHYPVYINAFCFTYDLAALLADPRSSDSPDPLGGNFRRHDWWHGLPSFSYQRDIEIFVAVKPMIEHAQAAGHAIDLRKHCVRFTRYDVGRLFLRKRHTSIPPKRWFIVTDVPQTAEELLKDWRSTPPHWLRGLDLSTHNIRQSFDRELHDLFSDAGKIYVFSAPMAYSLKKQQAKYRQVQSGAKPIETYFALRCNSGVPLSTIREIRDCIRKYFALVLNAPNPRHFLHPDVAWEYGRIATTIGQPHPFFEVTAPHDGQRDPATDRKMLARYAEILKDHHRR